MLDFIPEYLKLKILSEFHDVCEVRLRCGLKTEIAYLTDCGIKRALISATLTQEQIEECVLKLCNYSIFSAEESLKRGFLTSTEGERVGICGECVTDSNGQVTTIKSFSSLCIRIPHFISGCSNKFFNQYISKNSSCLVFSPPFQGKTTFIRDLGRNYSDVLGLNVLYIDERGEFNLPHAETGNLSDVLKYSSKDFGFKCGVRTLNPDVVVCDEMIGDADFSAAAFCMLSGVKTIASVHSDNIKNIKKKLLNNGILENSLFDFYVCIDRFEVVEVYDGDMKAI